jgi:mono/diheme cytochrome c family protein
MIRTLLDDNTTKGLFDTMAQDRDHRRMSRHRGASTRILVIGVVVMIMVGTVALSIFRFGSRDNTGSVSATSADANNPALVARGQQVYQAQCASCHGPNLEGQAHWQEPLPNGSRLAPPHDASGHTWHHPDQLLFEITKYGGQATSPPDYINNMPTFGNTLSDADIWAVLAYIKSTWPSDIRAMQEQMTQ